MHAIRLLLAFALFACMGCASPGWHFGRQCVDEHLFERTGESLGPPPTCEPVLPPGVACEDGVDEPEAVLAALWNNARFQELLVDLDTTRADIIQAKQLANPELWSVFPVAAKQLEFIFYVPLDAVYLRPKRITAAELESKRIGQRLVQDGLNLIRDVRLAHIDCTLAQDRQRIAQQSAELRQRIADLAEARLRAGEASELDVTTLRLDGLTGVTEAQRAKFDVDLSLQRLEMQMGVGRAHVCLKSAVPSPLPKLCADVGFLLDDATRHRPDLRAVQAQINAAIERAKLAKWDYLRVLGMLPDANGRGEKGFEAGPGVQFTVPIFNQNQGMKARMAADVLRFQRNYATTLDTIVLEVRQAHTRMAQAEMEATAWRIRLVPLAEDAVRSADKAFRDGGAPMLLVLEPSRQLLASQLRQAQAEADLRRAAAELDRAVGRHVTKSAAEEEVQIPVEEVAP